MSCSLYLASPLCTATDTDAIAVSLHDKADAVLEQLQYNFTMKKQAYGSTVRETSNHYTEAPVLRRYFNWTFLNINRLREVYER